MDGFLQAGNEDHLSSLYVAMWVILLISATQYATPDRWDKRAKKGSEGSTNLHTVSGYSKFIARLTEQRNPSHLDLIHQSMADGIIYNVFSILTPPTTAGISDSVARLESYMLLLRRT